MKTMSSVDIMACVDELRKEIVGGRVEKIYHYPPDEIRIKIYSRGRKDLVIEAGRRIHLTRFPRESPKLPSAFAMLLRKHLEGLRISNLSQYDFDRVVVMEFDGRERRILISELFLKGNIVLCDEDLKVIMDLRQNYKRGERYVFPEKRINPFEISLDVLKDLCNDEREIVKVLAVKCGLGGTFSEEICLRAGIDKNKKAKELNDSELRVIFEKICDLFGKVKSKDFKAYIVVEESRYIDVLPIELEIYSGYEKKFFEKFNDALDEFYSKIICEQIEKTEKESEKLKKLKKRLEIQMETKKKLEEDFRRFRRIGDLIYENYKFFEEILEELGKIRDKGFEGLRRVARSIDFVREVGRDYVIVEVDGERIKLDLNRSLHEIAEDYYEKSKRAREKLEGLMDAIEKTKKEMEEEEKGLRIKHVPGIRVVRKREWYERFRWFITSDGFLAIGGRNAKMNEEIFSKYMESNDLFFHTQAPGAPVVVLKNGQKAPERSIIETAQFSAIYSSLWKEGRYSGEVYYVLPEQVKKSAKPGEYLPRGSFYIVGKRNYISVDLSCAIGVDLSDLRVMGGPTSAVKKHCDYYVEIEIGDKEIDEIAVEISKRLAEMSKDYERHIVKAIASPDEIVKFLPPGRSKIKER